MKTLLLAITALIGMTSFADAQPPCAPYPWCASGNWLDKHCWCYRGPRWGYNWNDGGWNDDGGWWNDDGNGNKNGKHKHHKHHDD